MRLSKVSRVCHANSQTSIVASTMNTRIASGQRGATWNKPANKSAIAQEINNALAAETRAPSAKRSELIAYGERNESFSAFAFSCKAAIPCCQPELLDT